MSEPIRTSALQPAEPHLPRLYTPEEMAKDLGVPVSWIYSKTRQKGANSIPVLRVGKYMRFDPREVREWLLRK